MRFLVDRCAGSRLAQWLCSQGHDVFESRSLDPDPGDSKLLRLAVRQQRIVVTIDTDFGELIYLHNADHCGLIRLPDVHASKRVDLFEHILARHPDDLEEDAIITVRGNRIRVARKPRK